MSFYTGWVKSGAERQREPTGHVRFTPESGSKIRALLSVMPGRCGLMVPPGV
jgi:hypothetical protein